MTTPLRNLFAILLGWFVCMTPGNAVASFISPSSMHVALNANADPPFVLVRVKWDSKPAFQQGEAVEIGLHVDRKLLFWPYPSGDDYDTTVGFKSTLPCAYRDVLNYSVPPNSLDLATMLTAQLKANCGLSGIAGDAKIAAIVASYVAGYKLGAWGPDPFGNFTIGTTCPEQIEANVDYELRYELKRTPVYLGGQYTYSEAEIAAKRCSDTAFGVQDCPFTIGIPKLSPCDPSDYSTLAYGLCVPTILGPGSGPPEVKMGAPYAGCVCPREVATKDEGLFQGAWCFDEFDNDCNGCMDSDDKNCGACDGKQCGVTKCGQSCGNCTTPDKCEESTGKCVKCQPNCVNKNCGPDGCGKMCGTCSSGVCNLGKCCTPNCTGKTCGDDGCGSTCGTCANGTSCLPSGNCSTLGGGACPTWSFYTEKSTLGWFVPSYAGKSNGIHEPDGAWLVNPAAKDPSIDVKIDPNVTKIDGSKCTQFSAAMSTNCGNNKNACVYFKASKSVTSNGKVIDCTKLNEDHKVCGTMDCDWCESSLDMSKDPCWTQGGAITEIRFDFVDSMGSGLECSDSDYDDAGFDYVALQSWGPDCAPNSPPAPCYSGGAIDQIKGACKAGTKACTNGYWGACAAEVTPKAEVCDGQDNDCDGQTDEDEDAPMCTSFFVDNDGDGYGSFSKCLCAKSGKYQATSGGDCDDKNAQVNPGKNEQCNNLDDDCNGSVDEGLIPACDDGLPCTSDNCNAGNCDHQLQDGQCKIAGTCQASGAQQAGQPCYKCDPNQSTSSWSPSSGEACDDNDPCTKNDTCKSGQCAGTGSCDECTKDSDCQDDNDLCNGKPACDVAASPKKCKPNAKGAMVCDTSKDTVCQKTMCLAATGVCGLKNSNDGTACDADGSLCTTNDACKAGLCVAGAALACTDDNPCTDNGCDPAKGCTITNNTALCTDNNACTVGDVCAGGTCKSGATKPCADDNPCTHDACDPAKGCTNVNMPAGTACGGPSCVGLSYAATSTCSNGACVPPAAQSCDDANPCTNDACSVAAGCSHLPNLEVCDDGNACTVIDKCTMGLCQGGSPKVCSDGNACTTDNCDKAKGCVFPALADGTKCTAANCDGTSFVDAAVCQAGACQAPPSPVSCDDENACTTDACAPGQGCTHTANTADCSDSNSCTIGDKCMGSKCNPGAALACNDGNPCTTDNCDAVQGCVAAANTAPCDDSNPCTVNEKCSSGKCSGGTPVICDDNDPCTVDACTASVGCTIKAGNDGATCDDGNACTVADKCTGGSCKGTGQDCNDNNPCTADKCNPSTQGCYYEPAVDGTPCGPTGCPSSATWQAAATCAVGKCGATPAPQSCDDQNACTVDTCNAQLGCQHAQAPACTDNNPCTDDKCDPAKGCVATPNTAPCDDGNACTQFDVCSQGTCQGISAACSDNNPCTSDLCTPAKGCQYAAVSGACDADGKPCTADTCVNGKCQAALPITENCCNGIDDDCNGQTDECGIPLVVKYDALTSDKSLNLVYQSTADGAWTAVDTPGPGVQATVKLCPGNGTARFNLNWATPAGGRTWACDSDTQGGAEPVGQLPAVELAGKPAAVAMLPGSNGRICDFAVGIANGVPADPVVARPGELLVNSANLGNADCAILVGDYGEWLSGPAVAKQANGFFSFKIPGGRFPAGVWRFSVAKPNEGCGVVGSIGTVNSGLPINKGGPWADAKVAGMTQVGLTWAWSGDTLEWGQVMPSGSWRMHASATGNVLPAGSDSALDTATGYCKVGSTRPCATGGCSLQQTCLKHGWPYEAVSATAATWPASFWSDCSPKAAALPILASDKCGDGIDADCDGMDEFCGPLTGDGDFESYTGDGPWISWVGTSGATASIVQDVVARGAKAIRMVVPTAYADFWVAQVQNKSISLVQGKSYRLALWASSDKARSLRVTLEHSLNPADPNAAWVGDGVTIDFDLAPGWRRYEVTFVATSTVVSQLDFAFAEASSTVWLDGITVAPVP